MANVKFVTINDKDYALCVYQDGTRHYSVLTERRNQYGLRIQRTLNTPAIKAKIDAAVFEADHAEAIQMNADLSPVAVAAAHDEALLANMGVEFLNRVRLYPETVVSPDEAHAEALEMNEVFDYAERTKDMSVAELNAEFNATLTRVLDVEEAHAQALAMNEETDRRRADAVRRSMLATLEESGTLPALVEACHAEALEENARFDWLRARFGVFHVSLDAIKQQIVEEAHDEALRIEAERGTATLEAHL
jgi:hypothetical protein